MNNRGTRTLETPRLVLRRFTPGGCTCHVCQLGQRPGGDQISHLVAPRQRGCICLGSQQLAPGL